MLKKIKERVCNLILANPSKANYKFVLKTHSGLFDRSLVSEVLETKCFTDILRPIQMDGPNAQRVLVLAPHPDDDIFGAGGVLLRLAGKDVEIRTVYVTDAGGSQETQAIIQAEAKAVCARLSATPIFLHGKTRGIPNGVIEIDSLADELSSFRPDVVFTTFLLDDHPDHQLVNQILSAALERTGQKPEIWSYQIYTTVIPNVVVDITAEMDQKEELMRMWKSVSGNRDWAHYIRGMNAMNCRFIPGKDKIFGEGYFVLPASEYMHLCARYFGAVSRL